MVRTAIFALLIAKSTSLRCRPSSCDVSLQIVPDPDMELARNSSLKEHPAPLVAATAKNCDGSGFGFVPVLPNSPGLIFRLTTIRRALCVHCVLLFVGLM